MAKILVAIVVSLFSLNLMAHDQMTCGEVVELGNGLPYCALSDGYQECYDIKSNGDLVKPWFQVEFQAVEPSAQNEQGNLWQFMPGPMREMNLDQNSVEMSFLVAHPEYLSFRFSVNEVNGSGNGQLIEMKIDRLDTPRTPNTYKGKANVMTPEGEAEVTFMCEYIR